MEKGIIVLRLISSFIRWQDIFHVLERRQGPVGVTMRQIEEIVNGRANCMKRYTVLLCVIFFLLNKRKLCLQFSTGEGFKDK